MLVEDGIWNGVRRATAPEFRPADSSSKGVYETEGSSGIGTNSPLSAASTFNFSGSSLAQPPSASLKVVSIFAEICTGFNTNFGSSTKEAGKELGLWVRDCSVGKFTRMAVVWRQVLILNPRVPSKNFGEALRQNGRTSSYQKRCNEALGLWT